MHNHSPFNAATQLLANGGYIEQVSDTPLAYRVRLGNESAPLQSGLLQQLLTSSVIKQSCKVSGRMRYIWGA